MRISTNRRAAKVLKILKICFFQSELSTPTHAKEEWGYLAPISLSHHYYSVDI